MKKDDKSSASAGVSLLDVGDVLFQDSPDAGHPDCICSRCGQPIPEDQCPLRVFMDEGRAGEYRFCESCF